MEHGAEPAVCFGDRTPTDIFAVGDSHADSQQPNPLLEHYDGTHWNVVPLPHLKSGQTGRLRGIAIISASDIWVTGDSGGVVPTKIIAMHFDGRKWSIVPVPVPLNRKVHDVEFGQGVTAIATNDVWAVATSHLLLLGFSKPLLSIGMERHGRSCLALTGAKRETRTGSRE